jgi:uncharacterized membrane protein required for colicin V production
MLDIIEHVKFSWFDFLVFILVVIGFIQGRRHGMSEELLPLLQTLAMLVVASYYYEPLGILYAQLATSTIMTGYIAAYLTFVVVIKLTFAFIIKRAVGEKIISSDLFGRMEYYLGMVAGAIRWFAAVVIVLAIVNAREISPQQQQRERMFTEELVSQMVFPDYGSLHAQIFEKSFSGRLVQEHLNNLLIRPIKPTLRIGDRVPPSESNPASPNAATSRSH